MTRLNILGALAGVKGTGKSRYTIDKLIKRHPQKTLVFDVFAHPDYSFLPVMPIDMLPKWKKGSYRIIGDPEEILPQIAEHVKDCLLILEDSKRYIAADPQKYIKKMIIEHRNRNVDLFFQFHNLRDFPEYIIGMLNWLIMFKTEDPLDSGLAKQKWQLRWEEISMHQKKIREQCSKVPRNEQYKFKAAINIM